MSEDIISPDGKQKWNGTEWITVDPKPSQSISIDDSVIAGHVNLKKSSIEDVSETVRDVIETNVPTINIGFVSTLEIPHRVCIHCNYHKIVRDNLDGTLWCRRCKECQPDEQPFEDIDWEHFVSMGAPEFYLQSAVDVIAAIRSSGGHYTAYFREHEAHPWEAQMPEELREVCHIFYNYVRQAIMNF
jgi:hypothetical protein